MMEIAKAAGGFVVEDLFPSIYLFHPFNGLRPKLVKLQQEADRILDIIIKEHKVDKATRKVLLFRCINLEAKLPMASKSVFFCILVLVVLLSNQAEGNNNNFNVAMASKWQWYQKLSLTKAIMQCP
ncbi:hypothetical protein FEM48_Zijuj01G0249500 [Ziziphus jujuba var. spinosa]|uniref:Uncharacterized protein n=1 Tax=Ziziphus jujuba var. spinosa TaxID=714518 RepID=A0A978W4L3_ZIZJJ|nr:hypothetical protein FEM48_Zijuj01G0249500 [Ziziphus jujuba var. spinosa]